MLITLQSFDIHQGGVEYVTLVLTPGSTLNLIIKRNKQISVLLQSLITDICAAIPHTTPLTPKKPTFWTFCYNLNLKTLICHCTYNFKTKIIFFNKFTFKMRLKRVMNARTLQNCMVRTFCNSPHYSLLRKTCYCIFFSTRCLGRLTTVYFFYSLLRETCYCIFFFL